MEDFDYNFCEFIEVEMSFITYKDFCNDCKCIKESYNKLNKMQKRVYKWYVYSRITMNINLKNKIWEYLNCNDIYYYVELLNYCPKS